MTKETSAETLLLKAINFKKSSVIKTSSFAKNLGCKMAKLKKAPIISRLKAFGGGEALSVPRSAAIAICAASLGVLILLALSFYQFYSLRAFKLSSETQLKALQSEYRALLQQTAGLNEMLIDEKEYNSSAKAALERQASEISQQAENYQKKLESFVLKTDELKKKLDELAEAKEEIFNQLSDIPYIPKIDNTSASSEKPAYKSLSFTAGSTVEDSLEGSLIQLDASISTQEASYSRLMTAFSQVKPLLENYPSIWPVEGPISSYFGYRQNPLGGDGNEFHGGIDIAVNSNTSVAAAGGGVVEFAGNGGSYGNLVVIDHGMGLESYYGHNQKVLVSAGDVVERGQVIAKSGNTGRSTAPHVHYEIRLNGEAVDPLNYVI
ncbi:MAG: peptidoglycan DD-metalloendopeptidase family protein [Clostridiales bacterium]|nr:peptidoglycan DD-metalloendopeptidase family protein [Clostridiales bacterium]